ncbi:uncharacterized protein K444DRAFT_288837 [Hyaloscypha bicolor E]|uniref:Secreted protein n=1 Tax=Hyaloscypha bicolor E TaxID=1095630 RepID=A0A2J6TNK5_9HELO|nr:uncharacterized protein K444DRAFT_288837 [Hyaloscypha bicolor E]PMD64590.1 hypothetical protein K444DRAFT_288837 [Hyaloscypha bicolor E]
MTVHLVAAFVLHSCCSSLKIDRCMNGSIFSTSLNRCLLKLFKPSGEDLPTFSRRRHSRRKPHRTHHLWLRAQSKSSLPPDYSLDGSQCTRHRCGNCVSKLSSDH